MAERVLVIGVGPDGTLARPLPHDVALVVAGRRHLERHAPAGMATLEVAGDLDGVLDRITGTEGRVCVLASGDPGWFGILRRLRTRLGEDGLEVHPAVSSVAAAFAAVGEPWDDAAVVSAHGREATAALALALARPRVAVLTSPEVTPALLAQGLLAAGAGPRRVVVVERLGHEDGRVRETDLVGAVHLEAREPNVLLLLPPAAGDGPAPTVVAHQHTARPWARPADDYRHRDGQITKPVVRAVALAHLGAGPGRLVWDLGCGSGSVAVEAAGLGAGVIAVDRDPEQVARTRANAADHAVTLGTVTADASDVFAELPTPHAVYVGGGGRDLPALLDVVATRCRHRLAVPLATVERVVPTVERLRSAGWHATAQLLSVHDLEPLGDGHRLAPHNPVALVLAERP